MSDNIGLIFIIIIIIIRMRMRMRMRMSRLMPRDAPSTGPAQRTYKYPNRGKGGAIRIFLMRTEHLRFCNSQSLVRPNPSQFLGPIWLDGQPVVSAFAPSRRTLAIIHRIVIASHRIILHPTGELGSSNSKEQQHYYPLPLDSVSMHKVREVTPTEQRSPPHSRRIARRGQLDPS